MSHMLAKDFDPILRDDEVRKLDVLEHSFEDQYNNQPLTTAQRLQALGEIRKIIQLRCELSGLLVLGDRSAED